MVPHTQMHRLCQTLSFFFMQNFDMWELSLLQWVHLHDALHRTSLWLSVLFNFPHLQQNFVISFLMRFQFSLYFPALNFSPWPLFRPEKTPWAVSFVSCFFCSVALTKSRSSLIGRLRPALLPISNVLNSRPTSADRLCLGSRTFSPKRRTFL